MGTTLHDDAIVISPEGGKFVQIAGDLWGRGTVITHDELPITSSLIHYALKTTFKISQRWIKNGDDDRNWHAIVHCAGDLRV